MFTHSLPPSVSHHSSAVLVDAGQIEVAVAILRQGGLVAFPTETVYGLGANAESSDALDKLYTVKGRPKGHPVIVHLGDAQQLNDWAQDIPELAWKLAEAFWPGPLTLILNRSARVPDTVTGGQETVGIRVPDHPVALQLLRAFGGGIAAPSANRFGRLSPTRAAHVQADLGEDVDMIIDGGDCPVGVESTIVAFRNGKPMILRPGMITVEQIAKALESQSESSSQVQHARQESIDATQKTKAPSEVIRAPGTLASHYAPRTPLRLVSAQQLQVLAQSETTNLKSLGILAWQFKPQANTLTGVQWVNLDTDPAVYARQLYASLRELDQLQLDEIWVEQVPEEGAWAAVADRLRRAAHQD